MREFCMVIEQGEDGWLIGSVPELPGCHTQGRTMDELTANIKEAIALSLEGRDEPSGKFVGLQMVSVA